MTKSKTPPSVTKVEPSVVDQVATKLTAEADKAKALAEDVAGNLTAQAQAAADGLTSAVEDIDLNAMVSDATHFVRRNPGTSLLMALAAGVAIGAIAKRNS